MYEADGSRHAERTGVKMGRLGQMDRRPQHGVSLAGYAEGHGVELGDDSQRLGVDRAGPVARGDLNDLARADIRLVPQVRMLALSAAENQDAGIGESEERRD